jgi:uncharacterized membrane protein
LAYYLLRNGATLLAPGEADIWWLYSGDATSAGELLSSLLSGLITMTSLVVSITFVILTLAANQLGPRLITTFMADRHIQTVLGLFLGTILYVLFVLRTLDDELGKEAVPHIAVTVGSGLTVICLFALLLYVHKVARSIIADNVVEAVARDLHRDIREILPDRESDTVREPEPAVLGQARAISLGQAGYIQTVDYGALAKLARRASAILKVNVRAGHFVLRQGDHVRVHPDDALDKEALAALRRAFVIGRERTAAQDVEYGFRQLAEIALRALSAGINDTFTAIAVLDRLGAVLEEVLCRGLQPRILKDTDGTVRVVADRTEIKGLVNAAFDQIREAAVMHPAVLIRMADVLGQLAPVLDRADAHQAIKAQLDKLAQTAGQGRLAPSDHDDVVKRIQAAREALESRARRPRSTVDRRDEEWEIPPPL